MMRRSTHAIWRWFCTCIASRARSGLPLTACLSALTLACTRQAPPQEPAADTSNMEQPAATTESRSGHGHGQDHGHGHGHGHGQGHEHGGAAHAGPAPLGHRFEKAEDWVARFDDPERDAWQKPGRVVELMAIATGMVVADIGAGTGYFEPHLSAAAGPGGKVLALDIEPDMVRHLEERAAREGLHNVAARVVATDDPGLEIGTVDRVLVVNTWHHIPERPAYAEKLAKALRPGGAIYIVDYTMDSERGPPRDHRLAPEVVVRELEGTGLAVDVDKKALPNQYVVIAKKRP